MASNAWERAQEAIAHASQRATERDEDVITPDTAVSPFDASTTTVLPHGLASRAGTDPDLTQRIPHGDGHPRVNGHERPTVAPDEAADARTVRFRARGAGPGTSPFPASPFPTDEEGDEHGGRRGGTRHHDETPAAPPRRPWWRRIFGG